MGIRNVTIKCTIIRIVGGTGNDNGNLKIKSLLIILLPFRREAKAEDVSRLCQFVSHL